MSIENTKAENAKAENAKARRTVLALAGHDVVVSNPDKLYFPRAQITKLALVEYYLAVAGGVLRGVARRPQILKRFVDGAEGEPFYQKRAPIKRPDWVEVATFTFPSGRHADEIVVNNAAQLAYVINLGCIDLNPHAVRREDMDRPDELRIDLDPVPGVAWPQIVEVARVARDVLDEHGLVGWPKTSGSRGIHIWVRIRPAWPFAEVRRAGLALAREVERRAPQIATARWWKEERHGVFLDYNQNARDRTTASAYSVRPTPDARVSMPLGWDDLFASDPHDFTLRTVPGLLAARGDAHAGIDAAAGTIDSLLALAARQAAEGQADAPLPPYFDKADGEPPRVAPSRARSARGARPAAGASGSAGVARPAAAPEVAAGEAPGAAARPAAPQPPRDKLPVITIAKAKLKTEALAGLERWKARHPAVFARLAPEHVLIDTNRGKSSAWYRVRINLKNIPAAERPPPEAPDPDYDWKTEFAGWVPPTPEDPAE
ncbi:MAG TPA: DNA primase small subunit domain-containing protein [Kofleriaceae bacterium]|nr:DNA primase small subunit domain-containing protein [Kofleriaceae bacterium]